MANALPREQFGAVQTECLNSNQQLALLRGGDRKALDLKHIWSARFVDHDCFHIWHGLSPDWVKREVGW
ncbi:hypothetical protein [Tunturiibacter gelidoferens]|uniref:Uncharacterized protein n=1 Tax=Tunturiibacter gelidiferens TaxID=3069689 RepID=A0A9X0QAA3_9BACT|nr:hypothetical protein [Edaphobacter lichenicola]MBB5326652.1 hypothetical protein [Edaphobacter lichenicola]